MNHVFYFISCQKFNINLNIKLNIGGNLWASMYICLVKEMLQ